jgi:hypothetical protein
MRRANIRPYALAFSIGVTLCGTAHGEDWKATGYFGWLGVGKAYEIEKGHLYWLGEFSGAFANDKGKGSLFDQSGWKCPGFNDVDRTTRKIKRLAVASSAIRTATKPTRRGNAKGTQRSVQEPSTTLGGPENTRESMGTTRFLATFR